MAGAIFASTLTTICVFLPIVFTQGLSRELFTDMGLTIAYSLLASLVVALTLVPAMGATFLRNSAQKEHKLFDRFVNRYETVLRWSLKHKVPVLGGALALLIFSGVMVTQMGTAFNGRRSDGPNDADRRSGYSRRHAVKRHKQHDGRFFQWTAVLYPFGR